MFFGIFYLLAILSVTRCVDIDSAAFDQIFGISSTVATTSTPEETTTETTNVDDLPDACDCVPELCKPEFEGDDAYNASISGFGVLDIRFGEDDCKDVCCSGPISDSKAPRPQGCGYKNTYGLETTNSSLNVSQAQFGEFPWVIRLLEKQGRRYAGIGALIHPRIIITAAHVVIDYPPGALVARAGEWDIRKESEKYPVQERIVTRMRYHPNIIAKSLWRDYGALRVEDPFVLTPLVNVVCLPEQNEDFENYRNCEAAGWGKDVFGPEGRYADIQKKVVQNIVPHSLCEQVLKKTKLGNKFRLHDTFICAGGVEGKDLCQGDGGAPLVCPIGNNRYKLVGLAAWGIGCNQKNVPAVYAAVSNARSFIEEAFGKWKFNDLSSYQL